jgi:uncharacterized membrane protein
MKKNKDRLRLIGIIMVSLLVISTGAMFSIITFRKGDIAGGIIGIIIALSILAFAIFVFKNGNKDIKDGYPLHDERSRRVMEKATSTAFYISLYLLLAIGYLSEEIIQFRDVSQATSMAVGGMAVLFLISWIYYNKKEI